jgi:hypothetical protein
MTWTPSIFTLVAVAPAVWLAWGEEDAEVPPEVLELPDEFMLALAELPPPLS